MNFVNVRAIVLDIAIPLKSKSANNIEHNYNLPLGIKGIAISLKAHGLQASIISRQLIQLLDLFDFV